MTYTLFSEAAKRVKNVNSAERIDTANNRRHEATRHLLNDNFREKGAVIFAK